jgi:hypothetical protein
LYDINTIIMIMMIVTVTGTTITMTFSMHYPSSIQRDCRGVKLVASPVASRKFNSGKVIVTIAGAHAASDGADTS